MRVSAALDQYLVQMRGDGRSIHTVQQANRFVRKFIEASGDPRVDQVRHEDLAAFLASGGVARRADGGLRKPNSANALRSGLRAFFAFVHAAGYAPTNAARLVRRARCSPPRPRGLSDTDAERLMTALDTASTVAERRDRVMFRLTLGLGLRVGSVVALDAADIDFEDATLRVRTLKNRDQDTVFLSPALVELLRGYVGDRRSGPLFPSGDGCHLGTRQVGRRLELWSRRAGIEHRISPHGLRHAFAMSIYERTHDVLLVGRLLCHRSVASTSTYARPSESRARAALLTR